MPRGSRLPYIHAFSMYVCYIHACVTPHFILSVCLLSRPSLCLSVTFWMGQPRPLFAYFRPFHNTMISLVCNLKLNFKAKMLCLGFEPGASDWKDGRRRQIHWAMAGPLICSLCAISLYSKNLWNIFIPTSGHTEYVTPKKVRTELVIVWTASQGNYLISPSTR